MLYDRDIREPLFDFLEARYEKVRIIEEKQMGRSRADIVMVLPDALVGIEIKSDADTYARLARQVKDYDRFFDANYIVVGTSHAMHIEEHVPDWWGIITVDEEDGAADFYVLRRARENPQVDWQRKLGLLWRPELAQLQEKNLLPRYADRSKPFVIRKILESVPQELLRDQISDVLFERDYQEIEKVIADYRRQKTTGKKGRKMATGSGRKAIVHYGRKTVAEAGKKSAVDAGRKAAAGMEKKPGADAVGKKSTTKPGRKQVKTGTDSPVGN